MTFWLAQLLAPFMIRYHLEGHDTLIFDVGRVHSPDIKGKIKEQYYKVGWASVVNTTSILNDHVAVG